MTLDITDAEDAFLRGTTKFENWQKDFEMRWNLPLGKRFVKMAMASAQSVLDQKKTTEVTNAENQI